MDKPIAALFVGGPDDMTKRIIREFQPFIRTAEVPPVPTCPVPDEALGKVELTTHLYRARSEARPEGQPHRVIIYEYQGREQ